MTHTRNKVVLTKTRKQAMILTGVSMILTGKLTLTMKVLAGSLEATPSSPMLGEGLFALALGKPRRCDPTCQWGGWETERRRL